MGPLVVVQHQESVPPGIISEVLSEIGSEHIVLRAWEQDDWPAAKELGAFVVLGGTMNVDQVDAYPFIGRSISLMADALELGVPTLGVCLGSQMMAKVLGQGVYRAEVRNALFSTLELTAEGLEDPLMKPFSKDLAVLQFHEDTYKIPSEAVALATSSATGLTQAFRYGDSAYAFQFHFEAMDAILDRWCRDIGEEPLRENWGVSQQDLTRMAHEHLGDQISAGKELFKRFLEEVVGA